MSYRDLLNSNRRIGRLLLSSALAVGAAAFGGVAAAAGVEAGAADANAAVGAAQNSYADVLSRVTPAVVTVRAERVVRAPRQHPFLDDPSLRDFFGGRQPQLEQPREQPTTTRATTVASRARRAPDARPAFGVRLS